VATAEILGFEQVWTRIGGFACKDRIFAAQYVTLPIPTRCRRKSERDMPGHVVAGPER